MILNILGLVTTPLFGLLTGNKSQVDPIAQLKTDLTQSGVPAKSVDVAVAGVKSGKIEMPLASNLATQLKAGVVSAGFAEGIVQGIDSGKLSAPLATNLVNQVVSGQLP